MLISLFRIIIGNRLGGGFSRGVSLEGCLRLEDEKTDWGGKKLETLLGFKDKEIERKIYI